MPDAANTLGAPDQGQSDALTEPAWRARLRGSLLGNVVVLLVAALAVGLGIWFVNRGGSDVSQVEVAGAAAAPRVGETAPEFTANTIADTEVSLAALRGRPVWLLFVATWCSGCRAEMPDVQAAHEQAVPEGVRVIAIYVGETTAAVAPYSERLGLTFDQIADSRTEIAAAYGVRGVPAHWFIDADGVVRQTSVGVLSPTQIDQALAQINA